MLSTATKLSVQLDISLIFQTHEKKKLKKIQAKQGRNKSSFEKLYYHKNKNCKEKK